MWRVSAIVSVRSYQHSGGVVVAVTRMPDTACPSRNSTLAKEATTITDNVEDTEYVSHVKRNARATTRANWHIEWNLKQQGKYKGILFKTQRKQIDSLSKAIASRITQLRTQHGHMNVYLYEIKAISSRCSCGGITQNTEHVLLHCRKYERQRKVLREELKQRLSVHALLYTTRGIEALAKFLNTTDIYTRPNVKQNAGLNVGWGNLTNDQD